MSKRFIVSKKGTKDLLKQFKTLEINLKQYKEYLQSVENRVMIPTTAN